MELTIVGAGLAGSEAAWQAAERELHTLGSLLLACAKRAAVPAGSALAVDRAAFANMVTEQLTSHPRIEIRRREVLRIPVGPAIIATGPLTSETLSEELQAWTGRHALSFFDALAPILTLDSIDMDVAFRAARYDRGGEEGDYINCPMTKEAYESFWEALIGAERAPLRDFEQRDARFFEGCLPVEVIANRGEQSLLYGPLRPVGLRDPRTGQRPYAVVQLRQDNLAGTLYNLVGFQTNLRWSEQKRVFRMIPGLENADFVRFGQMHRNTYLNSPTLLQPTLQTRQRVDLLFAGQITGAEGYVSSIATGLLAGLNAARLLRGEYPVILPPVTMLGALAHYVTHADMSNFQPMKPNFGLLPPPEHQMQKRDRYTFYAERSQRILHPFLHANAIEPPSPPG
jgi:methylenetetrahydrofolate--tRNA-(uracil-5-)-methyltransferase